MTEPIKTPDRFDLEQQILDCWRVTDDIKQWADAIKTPEMLTLSAYYEYKFNQLWSTFESMIQEKKM